MNQETAQPLHSTWSKPSFFSKIIRGVPAYTGTADEKDATPSAAEEPTASGSRETEDESILEDFDAGDVSGTGGGGIAPQEVEEELVEEEEDAYGAFPGPNESADSSGLGAAAVLSSEEEEEVEEEIEQSYQFHEGKF